MQRRTFVLSSLGLLAASTVHRNIAFAQAAPRVPQRKVGQAGAGSARDREILGVAVNGKLYASQGLLPGFKPAGLLYEYDPARDSWSEKKVMPHPVHHAAVTAHNGKMYLFGGFDFPPPSGRRDGIRSPMRGSTTRRTTAGGRLHQFSTARGGCSAAVREAGGSTCLAGRDPCAGRARPVIRPRQPQQSFGTVEEYDPATNAWRTRAQMPTPCNHFGCEAVNGKVYAIGGRLSGAFIIGFPGKIAVQVYDPAIDSWATKAPMPTSRSGLNTAQLNGIIYAAGGEVQDQQYLAAFKAFEAYDPESDTWWQLPSMLLPRHECIMAAVGNRIRRRGRLVRAPVIVPPPTSVSFDTDAHEAFEVASS